MTRLEMVEMDLDIFLNEHVLPNIDIKHWTTLSQMLNELKKEIVIAHGRDTLMTAEQGRRIETYLKFLSQDLRGEEPYEHSSEPDQRLQ